MRRLVLVVCVLGLGCPREKGAPRDGAADDVASEAAAEAPRGNPTTDQALVREFEDFLATVNQCQGDDDCAVISPGCPLGCWAGVRADRTAAAEAKARELLARHFSNGRSCTYNCPAMMGPVCRASRCAVRIGSEPDAGAGAPPPPRAFVGFGISDGATKVGNEISFTITDPAGRANPQLDELLSQLELLTWPELGPVASQVEELASVPSVGRRFVVRSAAPLAPRWHLLRFRSVPAAFDVRPLADGTFGFRFRPDAFARVSRIEVCDKAGAGAKLVLQFSERVTPNPAAGPLVMVSIDGAPSSCDLYQATEGGLYFTCAAITPTSSIAVTLAAGLSSAAGMALAPGSWSFAVASLPAGSCRAYLPPF